MPSGHSEGPRGREAEGPRAGREETEGAEADGAWSDGAVCDVPAALPEGSGSLGPLASWPLGPSGKYRIPSVSPPTLRPTTIAATTPPRARSCTRSYYHRRDARSQSRAEYDRRARRGASTGGGSARRSGGLVL